MKKTALVLALVLMTGTVAFAGSGEKCENCEKGSAKKSVKTVEKKKAKVKGSTTAPATSAKPDQKNAQ